MFLIFLMSDPKYITQIDNCFIYLFQVKIWFQNRRARERRDKTSPSIDKDLSPGHYKERPSEVVTSLPGETRLQPKFTGP